MNSNGVYRRGSGVKPMLTENLAETGDSSLNDAASGDVSMKELTGSIQGPQTKAGACIVNHLLN